LRQHAQLVQKAGQWREAGGFWHALLGWDPQNSEARLSLEQCLREQGKKANSDGEWELAISAWEGLLQLKPGDVQAKRQLALVQQNQSYAQYYDDARQFIEENEPSPASMQLRRLWQYAPYYGDPQGLALKAGITKPLRSPATLDEEEEARIAAEKKAELARKQKEEAEREEAERQRREWERERLVREQKEKAEREKAEQERRERERREWEAWEARKREQEAWERAQREKERQERIEQEARERVLRRSPGWFIKHELETTPLPVWCSLFFLLSGLGMAVDIVTRSLPWALSAIAITMLLAYVLGHHRTIHQWPERLQQRVEQSMGQPPTSPQSEDETSTSAAIYVIAALAIIVISSLITLFFVNYVATFNYSAQQTGHFLWMTRSWWLDRQIKAGLAIGATFSLIIALGPALRQKFGSALGNTLKRSAGIGFSVWLICSLLGLIFDWGWGFGSRWEFGLLGFAVGVIAGVGLGSAFAVWKKARPIISGLF
jgi:uncharacterized membrane protein